MNEDSGLPVIETGQIHGKEPEQTTVEALSLSTLLESSPSSSRMPAARQPQCYASRRVHDGHQA